MESVVFDDRSLQEKIVRMRENYYKYSTL